MSKVKDYLNELEKQLIKSENRKLRADLAAARKWAKAWKMQATGERIQKEQAAKAFCDEATKRELLQESNTTLRAEIDRLKRGKSCDVLSASAIAHRACCGSEHDPLLGKIHGYCVVCGVPWPCETAQVFIQKIDPSS